MEDAPALGNISSEDIVYQIVVDRFRIGKYDDNRPGPSYKWTCGEQIPGSEEGCNRWYGGNLEGVIEAVEEGYFDELGVTALLFGPVFEASSYHGYDTIDYANVSGRFGGNQALDELLKSMNNQNLKVIFDGVVNHCSDKHPFFQDAVKHGPKSGHFSKFHITKWNPDSLEYDCWWNFKNMPKWNHDDRDVQEYLISNVVRWTEKGVNWRWDVPEEVPWGFWEKLMGEINKASPYGNEIYTVGEIWKAKPEWLKLFSGQMNYEMFGRHVLGLCALHPILDYGSAPVNILSAPQFVARMHNAVKIYSDRIHLQLNVLDTHDTARLATMLPDPDSVQLAVLLQMTLPGIPNIYYGTELFMTGGKDPDCRRPMPSGPYDTDFFNDFKQIVKMRRDNPALYEGDYECIHAENDVYAFARSFGEDTLIVAVNLSDREIAREIAILNRGTYDFRAEIPNIGEGSILTRVYSTKPCSNTAKVENDVLRLELPARSGVVLKKA